MERLTDEFKGMNWYNTPVTVTIATIGAFVGAIIIRVSKNDNLHSIIIVFMVLCLARMIYYLLEAKNKRNSKYTLVVVHKFGNIEIWNQNTKGAYRFGKIMKEYSNTCLVQLWKKESREMINDSKIGQVIMMSTHQGCVKMFKKLEQEGKIQIISCKKIHKENLYKCSKALETEACKYCLNNTPDRCHKLKDEPIQMYGLVIKRLG